MKAYYDIHIHSTLSACGDDLQTPNNILNMAMLKGLDIISVTDHNSLKQLPTMAKIVESYNFLFLYGVEVTVKEGFHVLAYFENLTIAMKFDQFLEDIIKKDSFPIEYGRHVICDEYDMEIDEVPYLLNYKIDLTLDEMILKVREINGIIILAHINRGGSGVLNTYEDFSDYDVDGIEIYGKENTTNLISKYPYLEKFPVLYNSDAHSLEIINERINFMELDELTFFGFKKYLKENKKI